MKRKTFLGRVALTLLTVLLCEGCVCNLSWPICWCISGSQMSWYFRNSEENDIQLFVLVSTRSASWQSTAPFQSSLPHQKPPGHLLTHSTSLPTFQDEPGVQLHLCWGLSLCVWHTMNVRHSKCQSMPADAHWDLEHHRFHCTNKCSRTWQGSCRLCKGRKTCQGWFSYRLGEHRGEE